MTLPPQPSLQSQSAGSRRFRRLTVGTFLGMLLLFVVVMPFLVGVPKGDLIVSGLLTLIMASGIVVVGASRWTLTVAAVLAVPSIIGKWLNHFFPELLPASFYLAGGVLFLAFVVGHLVRFTLRAKRVSTDVLFAGIATYLVLGILFALAYLLIAQLVPDAFEFPGRATSGRPLGSFEAVYYSFVTLSTMGYGDVLPLVPVARMLAMVEAMTGVFFISVLIARLVALYTTEAALEGTGGSNEPRDLD
jgi:hypothetical protein